MDRDMDVCHLDIASILKCFVSSLGFYYVVRKYKHLGIIKRDDLSIAYMDFYIAS